MAHLVRVYLKTNLIDLQREIDAGNLTEATLFSTSGVTGLVVETKITQCTTDSEWGIVSTYSGQEREGEANALAYLISLFGSLSIGFYQFSAEPVQLEDGVYHEEGEWVDSDLPDIYVELAKPEWDHGDL